MREVAGQTAANALEAERFNPRSVVVVLSRTRETPTLWWSDEVRADTGLCALETQGFWFNGKISRQIRAWEIPWFLLKLLPTYLALRRRYDYMFTFECSLVSFGLSFWQTLFGARKPRHVILQFIMREKTSKMSSKLQYAAMKWCFRSLHLAVCSAAGEAEYYRRAFNWPDHMTAFVPYHSTVRLVDRHCARDDGFIMAAGRVFRDYPTFFEAVGKRHNAIVVASASAPRPPKESPNISFMNDIPLAQFEDLMCRAALVVVPLEDRELSAGQLVMVLAMTLGKAVIATRTTGTVDYITHVVDGLLVEPVNVMAMREAIDQAMSYKALRARMGEAARRRMLAGHLPHQYTRLVRQALKRRSTVLC